VFTDPLDDAGGGNNGGPPPKDKLEMFETVIVEVKVPPLIATVTESNVPWLGLNCGTNRLSVQSVAPENDAVSVMVLACTKQGATANIATASADTQTNFRFFTIFLLTNACRLIRANRNPQS